jgi:hypothetical protein
MLEGFYVISGRAGQDPSKTCLSLRLRLKLSRSPGKPWTATGGPGRRSCGAATDTPTSSGLPSYCRSRGA